MRSDREQCQRSTRRTQRTTHDDCRSESLIAEPCGACDQCMYEATTYRTDHPAWLSAKEAAQL